MFTSSTTFKPDMNQINPFYMEINKLTFHEFQSIPSNTYVLFSILVSKQTV